MSKDKKLAQVKFWISSEEKQALEVKASQLGYISERSGRAMLAPLARDKLLSDDYSITSIEGIEQLSDAYKSFSVYTTQLRMIVETIKEINFSRSILNDENHMPFISEEDLDDIVFLVTKAIKSQNDIREKQEELGKKIQAIGEENGIKIR